MKRTKINRGQSRRLFTNAATRVHRKNTMNTTVMRGGIRL